MKVVELGKLCSIVKGTTGIQKAIPGIYPLVVTSEERKSHNEFQFDEEAVIVPLVSGTGHGHASIKRIHYQTGKFALGSILCAIVPHNKSVLNTKYLYYFLNLNKETELVARMRGMANVTLPIKEISKIEIPLPPLADQLFFINMYERLEGESTLIDAELQTQLSLVKQLRQAFLREAMEGKLCDNSITDETGQQLLEKIKAEKEALIREKKLKIGKSTNQPLSLIKSINVPENWAWCKVDDVFFVTKLAGFEYSKYIKLNNSGDVPVIRAQNVRPLAIDKQNLLFIDRKTSFLLNRCALTKCCLHITFIGAGIGDVATFIENERWHLAPNVAKIEPFDGCEKKINVKFMNYYMLSDTGQKELFKHIKATAQPSLSMGTIRDIDIPLPPITIQNQIVVILDRLMLICDQLTFNINDAKIQNEQLLQQVLNEELAIKYEVRIREQLIQ